MQHMRHPPGADFALIRKPPEHNSVRLAPDWTGKLEATMPMPALMY
jgi:hypothetical protein